METRSTSRKLSHGVHLELGDDGVAVITIDHPDKAVNVFDEALLDELDLAIKATESLDARGVIFLSGKPSSFIARSARSKW